jgi:hypothetical protein
MVMYLLSDDGRSVSGQVYTCVGPRISVWNQPLEVRSMFAPGGGRWTPEQIAEALPRTIKQEEHPFLAEMERRMKELEARKASEAGAAS